MKEDPKPFEPITRKDFEEMLDQNPDIKKGFARRDPYDPVLDELHKYLEGAEPGTARFDALDDFVELRFSDPEYMQGYYDRMKEYLEPDERYYSPQRKLEMKRRIENRSRTDAEYGSAYKRLTELETEFKKIITPNIDKLVKGEIEMVKKEGLSSLVLTFFTTPRQSLRLYGTTAPTIDIGIDAFNIASRLQNKPKS